MQIPCSKFPSFHSRLARRACTYHHVLFLVIGAFLLSRRGVLAPVLSIGQGSEVQEVEEKIKGSKVFLLSKEYPWIGWSLLFFWILPLVHPPFFGESIRKYRARPLRPLGGGIGPSKVLPVLSKGQIDFEFCRSCRPRSFGACRYGQAAIGERPCSYHGLHGKDHWRPDCPSFVHRGQVRWWLRPSLSCSSAACRFCALQFA